MSSLVIKLGSLLIKTLSKPIANRIKAQAREHERFRRVCIHTAQAIHRWDMRFKLGLLQDTATIEKQIAREAAEAQAKKHRHEAPTVKTEAQTKADEAAAAKDKDKGKSKSKESSKPLPKIRPLSEAKAIDSGANFVSETFLLLVGVALILGENWRQGRKASNRREDVVERIADLEKEVMKLRANESTNLIPQPGILPQKMLELEENPQSQGWLSRVKAAMGIPHATPPPEVQAERPKVEASNKLTGGIPERTLPSKSSKEASEEVNDPTKSKIQSKTINKTQRDESS